MIVTILKTIKKDPNTPFFARTQELTEVITQCKAEGKMLAESVSRSEDGLTSTYQSIWSTKEDYLEYIQLPEMIKFSEQRAVHHRTHGISAEFQILNYED